MEKLPQQVFWVTTVKVPNGEEPQIRKPKQKQSTKQDNPKPSTRQVWVIGFFGFGLVSDFVPRIADLNDGERVMPCR
jgi:hypothetical protein